MNEHDRNAIGLYAVLARDICDFLDMSKEAPPETLNILYLMLATPNPKHDEDTNTLNKLGAELIDAELTRRGLPLPQVPSPEPQNLIP